MSLERENRRLVLFTQDSSYYVFLLLPLPLLEHLPCLVFPAAQDAFRSSWVCPRPVFLTALCVLQHLHEGRCRMRVLTESRKKVGDDSHPNRRVCDSRRHRCL
jgi:hypothetical protein